MLLDLSFNLVKHWRASGIHSHGHGSVARDKVNIRGKPPIPPSVMTCTVSYELGKALATLHGS